MAMAVKRCLHFGGYTEKGRRSYGKSQRLNHLMVLHIHVNLAKDIDLIQVTNSIVLKKSVKNDQFVQSSNWILCIYKYVCVGKVEC